MQRLFKFLAVSPIIFLLTACPVVQHIPFSTKGETSFDNRLVGMWSNTQTEIEAIKVEIKAGVDDKSAILNVIEKGSMFMAESESFEAWLSVLKNQTFLVLKEIKTEATEKDNYYLYHLVISQNTVVTSDVSLLVGGSDAITSTETYREEVKASMDKEGFLSSPIEWHKN